MARTSPGDWRPADGFTLEPNALAVVKSSTPVLVTAGPGAGKTELLAQRADYLLRTGLCPYPKRILAVSLKVDAAANLRERVARRCEVGSDRFESVTLDAFAKRLVDRFRLALPPEWRPAADYAPRLSDANASEIWGFLSELHVPEAFKDAYGVHSIQRDTYVRRLASEPIVWPARSATSLEAWTRREYWRWAIEHSDADGGTLPFSMLSCLAELMLRTNPQVARALRSAYPFVFLDEFQDVTYWHYNLLKSAFGGSRSVPTAVGDTKQRIMVWAGADPKAGTRFLRDYGASQIPLLRNHRAAPRLIEVLNSLAHMVEAGAPAVEPAEGDERPGVCEVHVFSNANQEAAFLSTQVCEGIAAGYAPEEHCFIVRQRCEVLSEPVIESLRAKGVGARDETRYQELLKEVVVDVVLCALVLSDGSRAPDMWTRLTDYVAQATGDSLEGEERRVSVRTRRLVGMVRAATEREPGTDIGSARRLIEETVASFGVNSLRSMVPAYESERWWNEIKERTAQLLCKSREGVDSWSEAGRQFVGKGVVPAMTIHKSKGLEFDTVFFVGLEDSSWWAYERDPDENTRSFFVAFSRAKRRIIFTFAKSRDAGRGVESQTANKIRPLYAALRAAGVDVIDHRPSA